MTFPPNKQQTRRETVNKGNSIDCGEHDDGGSGVETVLTHDYKLQVARDLYRMIVARCPSRFVVLCDQGQVLAKSDRPELMPRSS
jgi:hypothetical protein